MLIVDLSQNTAKKCAKNSHIFGPRQCNSCGDYAEFNFVLLFSLQLYASTFENDIGSYSFHRQITYSLVHSLAMLLIFVALYHKSTY